jgi:UDPglucose 6-dehydrogenase
MGIHMKISIIGGGYVGTVTGACLADLGNEITIVDTDENKVDKINKGDTPLYEPGLSDLLKKNLARLRGSTDTHSAVIESDLSFICIGTPSGIDGFIDLSYIKSAAMEIGTILKDK